MPYRPRARALALGLLASLALPAAPAPAAAPRFVFGRSPSVFQNDPDVVATRLGLWLDASYVDNDRESGSVDLNHVNLLVDTRWRSFQGFLEVEYENEVDRYGAEEEEEFEIEQAYLRFGPRDGASLRLGRFNTPAGIWMPVHWSILMETIEKPPHAARELLPEQQVGAELAGRLFPGLLRELAGQLDYAVYAGASGDAIGQEDVEGFTVGADLRLLLDERWLLGTSVYRQKNDEVDDRSELNLMLYGEAKLPAALTFRTEYLHQRRERPRGKPWDRTLDVVYGALRWDFARWFYANYRVSFGGDDGPDERTTDQLVNTFTLGIEPHPAVRLKLEYSLHEFSGGGRQDFDFWGTSVGVRF